LSITDISKCIPLGTPSDMVYSDEKLKRLAFGASLLDFQQTLAISLMRLELD
jgi:hypothetical protein